jgi:hypothetical protein
MQAAIVMLQHTHSNKGKKNRWPDFTVTLALLWCTTVTQQQALATDAMLFNPNREW